LAEVRDWNSWREQSADLLRRRTGEDLATWNDRVRAEGPGDEAALRTWLGERGVDGYARMLLVMERFGYPDFLAASADQLVDGQYADRPALRPIYDRLIEAASALGEVTVQTRKTYVSLVGPRRTFARIQPTTRKRVDVGLRLAAEPQGRLTRNRIHESMPVGLSFTAPDEIDAEAVDWLRRAYDENA